MTICYSYEKTPIGTLLLAGRDGALTRIGFERGGEPDSPQAGWAQDDAQFGEVRVQLREYFAGSRRDFDLPLLPEGTSFQQDVWRLLREIPYGETRSYGWLANAIGRPSASRAVGAANGANPIPLVIPCHRVIGASGSLTGFGGGLPVKKFLLELEQRVAGEQQTLGFG